MPSVQTTTLNGLTSLSPTTPHPALLRITPVPISISPTHPQCSCITCTPGLPLPSLLSYLQLRKQCVRVQQSQFPHTLGHHIPGTFLRTLKMAVEDRPDLWDTRLQCLQTLWRGIVTDNHLGANRGRREYSGGFVMLRNSKVDLISCFSLDHTALILPSPSHPPLPSLSTSPPSPPSPL